MGDFDDLARGTMKTTLSFIGSSAGGLLHAGGTAFSLFRPPSHRAPTPEAPRPPPSSVNRRHSLWKEYNNREEIRKREHDAALRGNWERYDSSSSESAASEPESASGTPDPAANSAAGSNVSQAGSRSRSRRGHPWNVHTAQEALRAVEESLRPLEDQQRGLQRENEDLRKQGSLIRDGIKSLERTRYQLHEKVSMFEGQETHLLNSLASIRADSQREADRLVDLRRQSSIQEQSLRSAKSEQRVAEEAITSARSQLAYVEQSIQSYIQQDNELQAALPVIQASIEAANRQHTSATRNTADARKELAEVEKNLRDIRAKVSAAQDKKAEIELANAQANATALRALDQVKTRKSTYEADALKATKEATRRIETAKKRQEAAEEEATRQIQAAQERQEAVEKRAKETESRLRSAQQELAQILADIEKAKQDASTAKAQFTVRYASLVNASTQTAEPEITPLRESAIRRFIAGSALPHQRPPVAPAVDLAVFGSADAYDSSYTRSSTRSRVQTASTTTDASDYVSATSSISVDASDITEQDNAAFGDSSAQERQTPLPTPPSSPVDHRAVGPVRPGSAPPQRPRLQIQVTSSSRLRTLTGPLTTTDVTTMGAGDLMQADLSLPTAVSRSTSVRDAGSGVAVIAQDDTKSTGRSQTQTSPGSSESVAATDASVSGLTFIGSHQKAKAKAVPLTDQQAPISAALTPGHPQRSRGLASQLPLHPSGDAKVGSSAPRASASASEEKQNSAGSIWSLISSFAAAHTNATDENHPTTATTTSSLNSRTEVVPSPTDLDRRPLSPPLGRRKLSEVSMKKGSDDNQVVSHTTSEVEVPLPPSSTLTSGAAERPLQTSSIPESKQLIQLGSTESTVSSAPLLKSPSSPASGIPVMNSNSTSTDPLPTSPSTTTVPPSAETQSLAFDADAKTLLQLSSSVEPPIEDHVTGTTGEQGTPSATDAPAHPAKAVSDTLIRPDDLIIKMQAEFGPIVIFETIPTTTFTVPSFDDKPFVS